MTDQPIARTDAPADPPQPPALFREEALAARFHRSGSSIMIATPPSSRLVAIFAFTVAVSIIVLTVRGQLTRTVSVSGTLVPERGIIRIFSPQAGIIVAKDVKFGDVVHRGQDLYTVSSDRSGTEGAALADRVSNAVKVRIATLKSTIDATKNLQTMEHDRLVRQHDEIISEVTVLASQVKMQSDTVASDRQALARKSGLRAGGLIPIDQFEQSQRQLSGDEATLLGLQGSLQKLRQSLVETKSQLEALPLTGINTINELQRQLSTAQADQAENEMRREVVIAAPEDGTISADLVEIGQTVTTGSAMAVIAPRDALLEAHLLIPSSGIGFIKPNDLVALRYQAYPYQKFGIYEGHVRSISAVALSAAEMETFHVPVKVDEPIYRVTVTLDKQTAEAFGEKKELRAGMLVDAEIGAEKRRIYEWMFEPVYSMRGSNFFSGSRT